MIYAMVTLIIGAFCLFTRGWPIGWPILSLALASVAVLQGMRKKKGFIRNLGILSVVVNGLVVGMLLFHTYS